MFCSLIIWEEMQEQVKIRQLLFAMAKAVVDE